MSLFRSTWSMLLWKEWRQQRLPFLALGIVALAFYAMCHMTLNGESDVRGLLVLAVLVSTCLGANAFAAEKDDRTDVFLGALPVPFWRRGAVKYALVVFLACLCLAVPFALALRGNASPPSHYGFSIDRPDWLVALTSDIRVASSVWLVVGLFLVTASVSLTCLMAGRGLGSLATLMLCLAWWPACVLAHVIWGRWIIRGLWRYGLAWGRYQTVAVCIAWGIAHTGAIVPWLRASRTTRHRSRAIGLWLFAMLFLPGLAMTVPGTYRTLFSGPRVYASAVDPWRTEGGLGVFPSPDGKTLAIVANPPSRGVPSAPATWLVNVDSGKQYRLGRYGGARPHGHRCWSPDGTHLLVDGSREDSCWDWLQELADPKKERPIELWDVRVEETGPEIMDRIAGPRQELGGLPENRPGRGLRSGPPEGACGWLGDGTRAYRKANGWEFLDGNTGDTSLCRDPTRDEPARQTGIYRLLACPFPEDQRFFWLDHAIATVPPRWVRGRGVLSVQIYRPGLAEAECIDIPMDGVARPPLFTVDVSRDGKWLLGTHDGSCEPPYYLVSLADRTVQALPRHPGPRTYRWGRFTPDSKLIVVAASDAVGVWELDEKAWREEITFDPPKQPNQWCPGHAMKCSISPGRPWRLLVVRDLGETGMHVVNLEGRTSVRISEPVGCDEAAQRKALARYGQTPPPDWTPSVPSGVANWLGNDRLLIQYGYPREFWVINADGTNPREILR